MARIRGPGDLEKKNNNYKDRSLTGTSEIEIPEFVGGGADTTVNNKSSKNTDKKTNVSDVVSGQSFKDKLIGVANKYILGSKTQIETRTSDTVDAVETSKEINETLENKNVAENIKQSGSSVIETNETDNTELEGEDPAPYTAYKQDTNTGDASVAEQVYAERNKIIDDPDTGDASVAEQVYQSNRKPQDQYKALYQRNILLDYDTPTYHWKMSMLTERDTISAQTHIVRGNYSDDGFINWTPEDEKIIIAETGGTVLTLNSAEIITTAGPVNNGKRLTGAVDFTLNILQPLNASFTDTLVNAAIALGLPDGLKATYLLELHFIGRVPANAPDMGYPGQIVNPIEGTQRQFLIEIVSVDANVDSNGAQYVIRAARAGDKGIRSDHYQTDRPLQLNNLTTAQEMVESIQDALNENELDKLAIDKSILDEYVIKLDQYASKMIGDSELLDSATLENVTTDLNDSVQVEEDDTGKKMFRIPEGTSIDRVLEFGLSHSKVLQRLSKGLKDSADPDSSDSNEIDKYVKYIFHIKVDAVNIAWDILRNEYARTYTYTISMFPTIRPEILPGTWEDPILVEQEKIKELMKGDFSAAKSRPYKAMSKRYDYLFTGLNDKVLRFDIKYNNYFFFALHSYRSIFAGLDQATTKAKINKSSKRLIEFQEQRAEVKNSWKAYTKQKADILEQDLTIEERTKALSPAFEKFKKDRKELISTYVAGIKDGTFEGDENTIEAAGNLEYINEPTTHPLYKNPSRSDIVDKMDKTTYESNDPNFDPLTAKMYAELIKREDIVQAVDSSKKPFKIMWGSAPAAFNNKFNADNETPGKGHFDSVIEATLSDFSADMVYMDMDIRGDVFWLESERDPSDFNSMSMYEGENYLLFRAITSAGEPDPKTGIARPGDELQEQMLNGVYAVVTVTHTFENGQFTQNIKGVKEAFITDISKLHMIEEK